jgi:hypothetical protein
VSSHDAEPSDRNDPWREAGERFSELTDRLRERYRSAAGEEGPSEDQVRQALQTLGNAAQAMVDSVGTAARDPQVHTQVKDAAAGFISAIGQTLGQLGDDLRRETAGDEEE